MRVKLPKCANCEAVIFGGLRVGELRFCYERCYYQRSFPEELSASSVNQRAMRLRNGLCPSCGGPGPLDLCANRNWPRLGSRSWQRGSELSCAVCDNQRARFGMLIEMPALAALVLWKTIFLVVFLQYLWNTRHVFWQGTAPASSCEPPEGLKEFARTKILDELKEVPPPLTVCGSRAATGGRPYRA
jgi:hypothetical protein